MVMHAYNPSKRQGQLDCEFEASLGYTDSLSEGKEKRMQVYFC